MEPRHSWQTCTSDDSGLEKEANTHTQKKKKMKSGNKKQQCSESALLANFTVSIWVKEEMMRRKKGKESVKWTGFEYSSFQMNNE